MASRCIFAMVGLVHSCAALTFELPSNAAQKCLFEQVTEGSPVDVKFRVIGADYNVVPTVDAEVRDQQGGLLASEQEKTAGGFQYMAKETAVVQYCFRLHAKNRGQPVTISFSARSGERDGDMTQIAQKEHLTPIEESILGLARDLEQVQIEQRYMRQRERAHRNTSESTNLRVVWWSFFEAVALVLVSLTQIFYIKKLFETTRTV